MSPGHYDRHRRHFLIAAILGVACLADVVATLVIFGIPRAHRYAAMGQTALVGAAPAAASTHSAGGQWLAALLLAVVAGVVVALVLATIVHRLRRHPADRQWRRTLGRSRRAVRQAARQDRAYLARRDEEGWDDRVRRDEGWDA